LQYEERANVVFSNILEKGIIYFFFRPRVDLEKPHSMQDVAQSFFVLRPTFLDGKPDEDQCSFNKDARCLLMMAPKKRFPIWGSENDIRFVVKSRETMKNLREKFIAGGT